ncbi:MAG: hypothetical protein HY595_05925 [Candidatus Omnitrophica bacterium]|nr:hypothetical protein [Candidatus Omnitrophota bacterium]
MRQRLDRLLLELGHHLPYTIISSLIAMGAVWYVGTTKPDALAAQGEGSFHLLHSLHVCLSAIATTSVFWRYERRITRAVIVGLLGTIIPCGLSDYVFPFIGGRLLGQPMELHLCLVEHPALVIPFAALGVVGGLFFEERMAGGSVFSHGAHVFVSSLASLLYLVSFGSTGWMRDMGLVFPIFLVVVLAVWIPCCISDIVIPVSSAHGGHHSVSSSSV